MPKRFSACLVSVGLCLASLLAPMSASATPRSGPPATASLAASHDEVVESSAAYVVVLRDAPLASYAGGIEGYDATAPAPGHRFNASRASVAPYRDRLLASQRRVLASIGDPATFYSYTTVLNGFAAELTSAQLKQVQSMPGVLTVELERVLQLDSTSRAVQNRALSSGSSPATARPSGGTTALRRAWRSTGGVADAGRGVVIGLVDSGLWPENPSFDGVPLDRAQRHTRFPGFTGRCESGERWDATTCTDKVLAARYFLRGFGRSNLAVADFVSPRDGSGHGSHTAATAGGNAGVDVTIQDQKFGRVAGVAPGAALAVYKACWTAPDPGDDGCSSVDTLKAIDVAVSDGVDVLNYSISADPAAGSSTPPGSDAIELAFYHAATAGVFVATAAGDRGPEPATVAHASPWVTTVAATNPGSFEGNIRLGNGTTLPGSIVSDKGTERRRLVDGAAVAAEGFTRQEAGLCSVGSLDAEAVKDATVLCVRGVASRLSKGVAVSQAGGAAMVLANDSAGHTYADVHALPTLHVTRASGKAIQRYLARDPAPSASLLPAPAAASRSVTVADFSSRGPAPDADLVKPDLAAPGASVLAAVAPPSNMGRLWDLHSGTSMASPQVAGVAALLRSEHTDWSPAAVQSALLTTADRLPARVSPFDQGAGALNPLAALDPGLVYDAGADQWTRYLSSKGISFSTPRAAAGAPRRLDATDLNAASIAIGSLVGHRTVTRSVTNVSSSRETFAASRTGLSGIGVAVTPPSLTLGPGQTRSFEVSFSARSSARYGEYAAGSLTWIGSRGHTAESPVVIRPEHVGAPLEADGTSRGPVGITARAGVTGTVRVSLQGPVGARPVPLQLERRFFDAQKPSADSGAAVQAFDVAADTAALRFEAAGDAGDDVDLHVYRDGQLVARATSRSSVEQVTLTDPEPGSYDVYVNAPPADGEQKPTVAPGTPTPAGQERTAATFTGWVVPEHVAARFELESAKLKVTGGRDFSVQVNPTGPTESQRWFGLVKYDKSTDVTHLTIN